MPHGTALCYVMLYSAVWCCTVLYGAARHSSVLRGAVWSCMVLHGTARCCAVPYGAARQPQAVSALWRQRHSAEPAPRSLDGAGSKPRPPRSPALNPRGAAGNSGCRIPPAPRPLSASGGTIPTAPQSTPSTYWSSPTFFTQAMSRSDCSWGERTPRQHPDPHPGGWGRPAAGRCPVPAPGCPADASAPPAAAHTRP